MFFDDFGSILCENLWFFSDFGGQLVQTHSWCDMRAPPKSRFSCRVLHRSLCICCIPMRYGPGIKCSRSENYSMSWNNILKKSGKCFWHFWIEFCVKFKFFSQSRRPSQSTWRYSYVNPRLVMSLIWPLRFRKNHNFYTKSNSKVSKTFSRFLKIFFHDID